jgi:glycosyltransferase involved in cell wall biosynthesis
MRVLSIQHYPTFGGPTNEILTLDRPLRARGIETIVGITDEPGDALPRLRGSSVKTYALPLSRLRMTGSVRERLVGMLHLRADVKHLRGLMRTVQPDIVKAHGPHNPQAVVAARLEGLPTVWVVSSTRVPPLLRPIGGALVAAGADAVLVNGRALVGAYPGLRRATGRIFTYYPPVDVARFVPLSADAKADVRRSLKIPDSRPLVVTVANVNPQKGLEVFLEAASRLSRTVDCEFAIVGGVATAHVAYRQRLQADAERLGLGRRLHWLGARDDVERIVGSADVKLITSRPSSEGTTTTAGEALACGVPVVATNVGAVSEVVAHRISGLVVAADDAEEIARATAVLLRDEALRSAMGARGREIVEARFSAAACADIHARAYEFAFKRTRDSRT